MVWKIRLRRPSFGAVLGGLALAAVTSGVAVAALPAGDDGGVIQGCYHPQAGNLRIATREHCRHPENSISWNRQGPKGDKGDPGPSGPQGPAGPQGPPGPQHAATGFVLADGTVQAVSGPAPTVSRTGPGVYAFAINVAGACFVPSFNPWAGGGFTVFGGGGGCFAGGNVTMIVSTSDGRDHVFSYLAVPTLATATQTASRVGSSRGRFPRAARRAGSDRR